MRRFTPACFLAVALACAAVAACSAQSSDESKNAALQSKINALSQQLQTLRANTAASTALDLQSKCAVDAKRRFGEQISSETSFLGKGSVSGASFVNRYDQNRHQCFVVMHAPLGQGEMTQLLDANTGVAYATLWTASTSKDESSIVTCNVTSAAPPSACSSEDGFDAYVATYTGEPSLTSRVPGH